MEQQEKKSGRYYGWPAEDATFRKSIDQSSENFLVREVCCVIEDAKRDRRRYVGEGGLGVAVQFDQVSKDVVCVPVVAAVEPTSDIVGWECTHIAIKREQGDEFKHVI